MGRDVVGGERAAIVKRDAGPHQETISASVGRYLHRARRSARAIKLAKVSSMGSFL
jgi:hypothetical protein